MSHFEWRVIIMIYLGTPDLETERLLLRKFSLEDAKDMYEYASDPEVAKYMTWNPHQTINDSLGFIQFTLDRYEKDEAGDWGIVLRENNKFIGSCGFVWVDKKNLCGHIGYTLSKRYWNKGIMSEAVKRLLEFGFNEMNLHRIESFHRLPNEASGRVMQKVGTKYEGILKGRMFSKEQFWDMKQYAITKDDWLSNVK
jgi:ribosomal-protein-alanine N-acetyltransferase